MKSKLSPRWYALASALLLASFTVVAQDVAVPKGVERVTSVEGITEYRLANGLRVLLFPDPSKQTMTVNITFQVGRGGS